MNVILTMLPSRWPCPFFIANLDVLPNSRLQFTHAGRNSSIKFSSLKLVEPNVHRLGTRRPNKRETQIEPACNRDCDN